MVLLKRFLPIPLNYIIANGDPIGAVVIFAKEDSLGDVEKKAVETAAGFLARQMES